MSQIVNGFFRRFKPGHLSKMHLAYNMQLVINILETIQGAGGVTIDKPTSANGFCWTIRFSGDAAKDITVDSTTESISWPVTVVTGITVDTTDNHKLLVKTTSVPEIPYGYEEETVNIVTDSGIMKRTFLTKTVDKNSVLDFSAGDNKLLLQVNSNGKLCVDRGYLV